MGFSAEFDRAAAGVRMVLPSTDAAQKALARLLRIQNRSFPGSFVAKAGPATAFRREFLSILPAVTSTLPAPQSTPIVDLFTEPVDIVGIQFSVVANDPTQVSGGLIAPSADDVQVSIVWKGVRSVSTFESQDTSEADTTNFVTCSQLDSRAGLALYGIRLEDKQPKFSIQAQWRRTSVAVQGIYADANISTVLLVQPRGQRDS